MNGEDKTKEQLIEESGKMRQQLTELETLETERKRGLPPSREDSRGSDSFGASACINASI